MFMNLLGTILSQAWIKHLLRRERITHNVKHHGAHATVKFAQETISHVHTQYHRLLHRCIQLHIHTTYKQVGVISAKT